MSRNSSNKTGPVVSVLIPTFNRRRYLPLALASALGQSYENLQVIVVNDGGEDVSDIIDSFDDPRVVFINRSQNRGKACSLNEAIERVRGKYICYLDDDDLYYPHHVETLVNTLESSDCQAAYNDLYNVHCKILPDGRREVLSKVVDISRDFNRFFMLCYNHILHVSLMHRTELLEKTGLYNEAVNILIDWDITRRMVFYTDFQHVHEITGEFYTVAGGGDRISIQRRKDEKQYKRNFLTIRTTRPPKPWSRIEDLSIIFTADRFDRRAGRTLGSIWQHTFYPYQLYLPLSQADLDRLNTDIPSIVPVPLRTGAVRSEQVDTALSKCESKYVAIVPSGFPVRQIWIEDSLHALINSCDREALELEGSTESCWAVVTRKDDLVRARSNYAHLPLRQSLEAAGVSIRHVEPEEIPFQYDQLLQRAREAESDGRWLDAANIYEYMGSNYGNELWTKTVAAKALFKAGDHTKAAELACWVNDRRPSVESIFLEAKIRREQDDIYSAIKLFKKARAILENSSLSLESQMAGNRH